MAPLSTVRIEGAAAESMLRLVDALEDLDDVQDVYANYDISDEEMTRFAELASRSVRSSPRAGWSLSGPP